MTTLTIPPAEKMLINDWSYGMADRLMATVTTAFPGDTASAARALDMVTQRLLLQSQQQVKARTIQLTRSGLPARESLRKGLAEELSKVAVLGAVSAGGLGDEEIAYDGNEGIDDLLDSYATSGHTDDIAGSGRTSNWTSEQWGALVTNIGGFVTNLTNTVVSAVQTSRQTAFERSQAEAQATHERAMETFSAEQRRIENELAAAARRTLDESRARLDELNSRQYSGGGSSGGGGGDGGGGSSSPMSPLVIGGLAVGGLAVLGTVGYLIVRSTSR